MNFVKGTMQSLDITTTNKPQTPFMESPCNPIESIGNLPPNVDEKRSSTQSSGGDSSNTILSLSNEISFLLSTGLPTPTLHTESQMETASTSISVNHPTNSLNNSSPNNLTSSPHLNVNQIKQNDGVFSDPSTTTPQDSVGSVRDLQNSGKYRFLRFFLTFFSFSSNPIVQFFNFLTNVLWSVFCFIAIHLVRLIR
jgi:hypothetical protein